MKWILDHLQFVILVVWAFAFWLKKVIDHRMAEREAREAAPQREDLPDGFDRDAELEEEISLEAWEVSSPPPPFPPSMPPPFPPAGHPGGMGSGAPQAGPWQAATVPRESEGTTLTPPPLRDTRATTTGGAAATRLRISIEDREQQGEPARPLVRSRSATLRHQLNQRAETRRAIILKEIVSRPVSLRAPVVRE